MPGYRLLKHVKEACLFFKVHGAVNEYYKRSIKSRLSTVEGVSVEMIWTGITWSKVHAYRRGAQYSSSVTVVE